MLCIDSRVVECNQFSTVTMGVTTADIELADEVRKFPALYNKADNDYHQSDVVENCWERVRKQLGMEDWKAARQEFVKLRKRFNKQRAKVKQANVSGTSHSEMIEACGGTDELVGWQFLSWLKPFIATRQTKSNSSSSFVEPNLPSDSSTAPLPPFSSFKKEIMMEVMKDSEYVCDGNESTDTYSDDGDEDTNSIKGRSFNTTFLSEPEKQTQTFSGKRKAEKNQGSTSVSSVTGRQKWKKNVNMKSAVNEEKEDKFLKNAETILEIVKNDVTMDNTQRSFSNFIVGSLQKLPEQMQYAAQSEIANILFKYQASYCMQQQCEKVIYKWDYTLFCKKR